MEAYRLSEEDLALIERSEAPQAVCRLSGGRFVPVALSAGFCRLFGYADQKEARDALAGDVFRAIHPDDLFRVAGLSERFAAGDGDFDAVFRVSVGEETRFLHAQGRRIGPEDGERLALFWYTDEGAGEPSHSLRQAMQDTDLFRESRYDSLTGLPGMSWFSELTVEAWERMRAQGEQPVMLFFDLCGMKLFNRSYGFAEGDRLICAFAKLLLQHFGVMRCCRFAKDNFAAFTANSPALEPTLYQIFEECRCINEGKSLPVRVGVYLDRGDGLEGSAVWDRAKAACDTGRNSYISGFTYFDESMMTDALNRRHIVDDLDRAIDEKRIQVYYQPIIRAANGRICNEEALARWIDTDKGMLAPASFIPVLEEAALIYKLDLCVLEIVLDKIRDQAAHGVFVVPTSVNVSRVDFDACDIVAEFCRRVDAAGVERRLICIELTESVIGSDFDFMKAQIDRFRAEGFPVWMDDFGNGYSSLDLLQSIQFDIIKFDLRFMQKFDASGSSRIILTELMKLAQSIGVETVAEGVETNEQAEFLYEIGCTKLQGFYYSPPNSLEAIRSRYASKQRFGFENPEEAAYFAAVGNVNLYNPNVVSDSSADQYRQYFDSIPMAVLEIQGEEVSIIRCNPSYRDMLEQVLGMEAPEHIHYARFDQQPELDFFDALRQSARTGDWAQFDRTPNAEHSIHSYVRRIAVNPVTQAVAAVSIVLPMKRMNPLLLDADLGESAIEQEMHSVSLNSVARALSSDYICVYYVNIETEQFGLFTSDPAYQKLGILPSGEDFFGETQANAQRVVYPEDRVLFERSFTKERVVDALDKRPAFTLTYRLMIDGAPRYVHLKATRMRDRKNGILIGISDIDAQMKAREAYERARDSSLTYAHIAQALSKDYVSLYYVDLETDRFIEYSSHSDEEDLSVERQSEDFFNASRADALRFLYPEDQARFLEAFRKELIISALDKYGVFTLNYRLMRGGAPIYVSMKASRMEDDDRHIIIGVSSIDAQMRHQEAMERVKEERITYARITALSGDYIAIYTVDPETDRYVEYSATTDYEDLGLAKQGEDFFASAVSEGTRTLYYEDLDMYLAAFTKEKVMEAIARKGFYALNYRLMIEGEPTYVRLKAGRIEEKDGPQLIVGVININDQVRRDQEYANKLSEERNKANFDALTGVKNKHAYIDVEARLNHQIEEGLPVQFALVVCDVNGLKQVNDTMGHQAGDRFLLRARTIICNNFKSSPVFRVGGDEFAVLMQGQDFDHAEEQVAALEEQNRLNAAAGEITIACGLARYEGDRSVAAVFERADARMYANKRAMKARSADAAK